MRREREGGINLNISSFLEKEASPFISGRKRKSGAESPCSSKREHRVACGTPGLSTKGKGSTNFSFIV